MNKPVRRKSSETKKDHDILGIVLIIISAFLLICTLLPIVFGFVGEAIRNVMLGLFGLSTYAIICLVFAIGLGIVTHRTPDVSVGKFMLIFGMAFSFICLLQLFTTTSYFDLSYGEYLSAVYKNHLTAGGIIFGAFAYGLKSLVQVVAAYVILGVIFLSCGAGLAYSIYKKIKTSKAKDGVVNNEKGSVQKVNSSFTDNVPARPIRKYFAPTKLFVEDIVKKEEDKEIDERQEDFERELYGEGRSSSKKRSVEQSEAEKLLYNPDRKETKMYGTDNSLNSGIGVKSQLNNWSNYSSYHNNNSDKSYQYNADIHRASEKELYARKPDKVVHDNTGKMPDLVIPTQKGSDRGYSSYNSYSSYNNIVNNSSPIMNTTEALKGGLISETDDNSDKTSGLSKNSSSASNYNTYTSNISNTDAGIFKFAPVKDFYSSNGISGSYNNSSSVNEGSPIINSEYFAKLNAENESSNNSSAQGQSKGIPKFMMEDSELTKAPKADDNRHVGLYDSFSAFSGTFKSAPKIEDNNKSPIVNSAFIEEVDGKSGNSFTSNSVEAKETNQSSKSTDFNKGGFYNDNVTSFKSSSNYNTGSENKVPQKPLIISESTLAEWEKNKANDNTSKDEISSEKSFETNKTELQAQTPVKEVNSSSSFTSSSSFANPSLNSVSSFTSSFTSAKPKEVYDDNKTTDSLSQHSVSEKNEYNKNEIINSITESIRDSKEVSEESEALEKATSKPVTESYVSSFTNSAYNDFDEVEEDNSNIIQSTANIHDTITPKEELIKSNSNSYIIEDAVVDLTERDTFEEEDNSGYYESVAPKSVKTERASSDRSSSSTGASSSAHNNESTKTEKESPLSAMPQPQEPYNYSYPPITLLNEQQQSTCVDASEIESKSRDIEEVLASLKFPAKVINVVTGPRVTRYELQPPGGIPVRKILTLDKDLEFTLARGTIRIEAPVANKQAIGIEVANNVSVNVGFREIIESTSFKNDKSVLTLALGKDIGGDAIVRNLEKMPHLLIAGTTGTGKSVCLNTLILSLIYRCSPEDVRIVLVDPKQVEFTLYRELPHLLLRNPITDVDCAVNAFDWLIDEMNRRYSVFSELASMNVPVRNLAEYNSCSLVKEGKAPKMPYLVMIVDELADLMTSRKRDVENRIRTITQKSRASGIHLVLATQRPSVDVITGTIKINLPSRIAFKVTSNADSRTILDQGGAETLLGNGDMLLMSNSDPIRLQGAYVSNDEIVNVVDYVKKNNKAIFDENIENTILAKNEPMADLSTGDGDEEESADEKLYPDIMRCIIHNNGASASFIQRRFSLGYSRASRIMDALEARKWIGPPVGAKQRVVYMTEEQFEAVFGRPFDE